MRHFLGYVGVTEFGENIGFVQSALVLKISLKCVFVSRKSVHDKTNWITMLKVHEDFTKTISVMLFRLLTVNQTTFFDRI